MTSRASTLLLLLVLALGCEGDDSAFYDAGTGDGGATSELCTSDVGCPLGHHCVFPVVKSPPAPTPSASDDDGGQAPSNGGGTATGDGLTAQPDELGGLLGVGRCSLECEQARCGPGRECLTPHGECAAVDCGHVVSCASGDSPLYCDLFHNTCFRESGQCGTVGRETYYCPKPNEWDGEGVSIHCDRATGEDVGTCRFEFEHAEAPHLFDDDGKEVPRTLRFVEPAYGASIDDLDELVLRFTGSSAIAFVALLRKPVTLPGEIMEQAVWIADLPSVKVDGMRSVRFRDGYEVKGGTWQSEPPSTLDAGRYYAMALASRDGRPIGVVDELLLLHYQVHLPEANKTKCDPSIEADGKKAAAACENPARALACIRGTCRQLCLSREDCARGESCSADRTFDVRYCR